MKIALLIPGFVRNFQRTFPYFNKHILKVHKPDIFIYGYNNSPQISNKEDILNMYKPKLCYLDNWTEDIRDKILLEYYGERDTKSSEKENGNGYVEKTLSQFYNIKKAFELCEEFSITNNIKYDVVIRSRAFEQYYFDSFDSDYLEQAKEGLVIIPSNWDFPKTSQWAVTDNFFMSSFDNMKIITNLFSKIRKYCIEDNVKFHPETLLGYHIEKNNFTRIKSNHNYEFHEFPDESRHGEIIGDANLRYKYSTTQFE